MTAALVIGLALGFALRARLGRPPRQRGGAIGSRELITVLRRST